LIEKTINEDENMIIWLLITSEWNESLWRLFESNSH